MHATDRLTATIRNTSPVCVGLDPMPDKFPVGVPRDPDGMTMFCNGIIDAVTGVASSVKPQLAYFEAFGWQGMKAFWDVCAYAKSKGLVVIADGKRNDIGATCEAYAEAYLHQDSPIDFLTVSPYLGSDGIKPFIEHAAKYDKGIFVLVKTSNPSSGELQDLPVGDEAVHEHLAQLVESWAAQHLGPQTNLSLVGAVVGATYPEEMTYLRTLMPHVPFLIPGYGTQGGTAADAARGFIPDPAGKLGEGGAGAIVAAARSIIYASNGKDWQEAARAAAQKMASDLKAALKR